MKKVLACMALMLAVVISGCNPNAEGSADSNGSTGDNGSASDRIEMEQVADQFREQGRAFVIRGHSSDWLDSVNQFHPDGAYKTPLPLFNPGEELTSAGREKFDAHRVYLKDVLNLAYLHNDVKSGNEKSNNEKNDRTQYSEQVINSLDWWFSNYTLPQGVYNVTFGYQELGNITDLLSNIGNLLYNNFHSEELVTEKSNRVKAAIVEYGLHNTHSLPQLKGANWAFRSITVMRYLVFANDPGLMNDYMELYGKSLTLNRGLPDPDNQSDKDGIWPDGSFTHHGDMNYWGMYGVGWLSEVLCLADLVKGTRWAFTDKHFEFLEFAIMDGARWVFYRGNVEYSSAPKRATYLIDRTDWMPGKFKDAVGQLMALSGDAIDQQAMKQLYDNIDTEWAVAGNDQYQEFDGHRMFWNTDYQVHRRNNYSVAVRRSSLRTRAPEDRKETSFHLHFGSGYTSILTRNDEYRLARLGMDYSTLPGTTLEKDQQVNSGLAGSRRRNQPTFSAGTTDGLHGVGSMQQRLVEFKVDSFEDPALINGAGASKSNFFFESEIVNLGSSVERITDNALAHTGDIWTTVNQVHRTGDIWLQSDDDVAQTIEASTGNNEDFQVSNRFYLWHGDIGYIIQAQDTPVSVKLLAERRPLNPALKKDYLKALSEEDRYTDSINMLQLAINHGPFPDGDRYQYTVVPAIDLDSFQRQYVKTSANNKLDQISVLQNDCKAHAVYHKALKMYGIVFFEGGNHEVILSDGRSIRSEHPVVLMIKEPAEEGGEFIGYLTYGNFQGTAPSTMKTPDTPFVGTKEDNVVINVTGFPSASNTNLTIPVNTTLGEEGSTVKFTF